MGVTSSSGSKGFTSTGEGVPTSFTGGFGRIGVTGANSKRGQTEVEPAWVKTVQVPPECAQDCVGMVSDGMTNVSPCEATQTRLGHFDSDGIRWSRGFTSGKHSFRITYPARQRGNECTVGVGTEDAPLYVKGKVPLVGYNRESWGISLRTKRAFHNNAELKKFPSTQALVPDIFYLYLDADAGQIKFGSGMDFYGTAVENIPRGKPLYPMVSCIFKGAVIKMEYCGQASNAPPPAVGVVMVTQDQPPPYQESQEKAPEKAAESAPPAEEGAAAPSEEKAAE